MKILTMFSGALYLLHHYKRNLSHCVNMTFYDKSRYDRIFRQVTHKGGEYAMTYIKRFQNTQALLVSVGKNYSEYQLMHIFMDNFHQCGKYSSQIASQPTDLKREEKSTDQKSLSSSSLLTDFLNLDSI